MYAREATDKEKGLLTGVGLDSSVIALELCIKVNELCPPTGTQVSVTLERLESGGNNDW